MSDNSIKWMPLVGMELSAENLAAAEKLRRFGFVVNCSEFGSEKFTKVSLCIYDVLAEKEIPNILLITSNRELYGWYRILITSIGADFKIITGAANAVAFFSKDCPNLYLMSSEALAKPNGLKARAGSDFVWDLVIIDEEQCDSVPDYGFYSEQLPWKSEKLIINAPFPAKKDEDREALVSLIKGVLSDSELAASADEISFDAEASVLSYDSTVMRYYDSRVYSGELKRKIMYCDYEFTEASLAGLRKRTDLRTGLPSYRFGGNIFEDYDSDEIKRTYLKPSYTRSDVEDLRGFDKKLDSFLKLMDDIMREQSNRAIVYCSDKNTIEYLRKVLTCVYSNQGITIKAAKGEFFDNGDIIRKLKVDDSADYPRIVLGVDGLGAVGDALDRINYIINYELPSSAALLERRMTRHGSKHEAERTFVLFRDKGRMFDTRVLEKLMFTTLSKAFAGNLPTRNILLDLEDKAAYVNAVTADLKYIIGYAKEVDNCLDLIKKVKCDYPANGVEKITNAKQLAEFAEKQLSRLYKAFGISEQSSEDDITAAVNSLGGLCTLVDGRIVPVSADILDKCAKSFSGEDYKLMSFAAEALDGVEKAKKRIDDLHKDEKFHLLIKNELMSLNDCIQYPVLFGIWRYRVREQDSNRSFREYIKIYNDGV
ncbi:MAG: hypothetical protein ACI4KM_11270 [Oscillospiraceae bacterium]